MTDSRKRRSKPQSIHVKPAPLLSCKLAHKDKADNHRDAALRGWEKRRATDAARLARWELIDDAPEQELPDDDLIRAIHNHAAEFYTRNDLIIPPHRQIRQPWGTKKRKLLEDEGAMATSQKGATEVATGADPSRGRSDDQEEDVQSENHPTAPKSRQAYKQRDMYRALDGSALLALGFLVEGHIAKELRRVGYAS